MLEPDIRRAIDHEASEVLAGEDYERSREFIELLYFTGRGRADNLGGEDIFVAEWKDGQWQNARLAPVLSSRSDNESAESISADGRSMILFRPGRLSYSEWQDSAWPVPRALPSAINCNSWQADGRLAADGRALLFASRKENGDTDIYASLRQPDGSWANWSEPVNLGRAINTKGHN